MGEVVDKIHQIVPGIINHVLGEGALRFLQNQNLKA